MSGHIYCFNTHENPNIIKAGHTQQDVPKRLRGYLGPSKPRTVIFSLKVNDSVEAEKMMLQLMQQCVSLNKRHDLGNEWFETIGCFNFEQRATHLQAIARIVQKASNIIPIVQTMPQKRTINHNDEPTVLQATNTLPGLEEYFKNFDDFVTQEAQQFLLVNSPQFLLRSYEASTFCIHICQFLPFTEEDRTRVTAERYKDFLS